MIEEPNDDLPVSTLECFQKIGILTKRGKVVKNWKARVFARRGKELLYFKSYEDVNSWVRVGTPKPQGMIPLDNASMYIVDYIDMDFCFEISCPSRNYYLCANSSDDVDDWLNDLESVGVTLTAQDQDIQQLQNTRVNKQGFLEKRGGFNPAFKNRFFRIMTNGDDILLAYFKYMEDLKPRGAINLTNSTVISPDDDARVLIIEQSSPAVRKFILRAESLNERDSWALAIKQALLPESQQPRISVSMPSDSKPLLTSFTLYQYLRVPNNASQEQIEEAFHSVDDRSNRIIEAYQVLHDPIRRSAYDSELMESGVMSQLQMQHTHCTTRNMNPVTIKSALAQGSKFIHVIGNVLEPKIMWCPTNSNFSWVLLASNMTDPEDSKIRIDIMSIDSLLLGMPPHDCHPDITIDPALFFQIVTMQNVVCLIVHDIQQRDEWANNLTWLARKNYHPIHIIRPETRENKA